MRRQSGPGHLLSRGSGLEARLDPLRSKAEEVWSGNETSVYTPSSSAAMFNHIHNNNKATKNEYSFLPGRK